jgi:hypothetical protein
MTSRKRKSKPTYSPLIEWPTEQLQLVPGTVERKTPIGASASWLVETGLPVTRLLNHRGKITLHYVGMTFQCGCHRTIAARGLAPPNQCPIRSNAAGYFNSLCVSRWSDCLGS